MNRTWSGIVIAATGGFILLVVAYQDISTPNAVIWEPADIEGHAVERADGLVLQEANDGVLWASDGFSIYRSEGERGFLKVHTVRPSFGLAWLAHSRALRRLFGYEETIEVFSLNSTTLLVFAGGDIHRIDLRSGKTEVVHHLRYFGHGEGRGVMPFGMTVDRDGHIYYGEYVTRRLDEGETVALFRSDKTGRNFDIVYEFPAQVVRHIHAVQWDPYGQVLWMGTGDGNEQSRIGYSKDLGETFVWIGQDSQDFRAVNFVFSEHHVDWLSDTVDVPSRAVRWHRATWEIQRSAQEVPGHGQYMQRISHGFSVGTTGEEAASLWLIGPELGLQKLLEWPISTSPMSGFGTVRLARGRPEIGDWLHVSPLRVEERQPAIYRLSKMAAFQAAGLGLAPKPRLVRRDDP